MVLNNSLTDSIIRIKNGHKARKKIISLINSKLCVEILTILQNEGYIRGFKIDNRSIKVYLKYFQDRPAIKDIISYSHLSAKSILSFKQLQKHYGVNEKKLNGLGLTILSTPLGVLSDYDCINNKSGGKLLLTIL